MNIPFSMKIILCSLLIRQFGEKTYLDKKIFTNNLKISTVALGLFRSTIDIKIGQQAAAAVITLIPVVLLMIFFQQYITKVVLSGSNK